MANREAYYQACMNQRAEQEALSREFNAKTLGILTFCITIFSVGMYLSDNKCQDKIWFFIMLISLICAISLGLCILMPRQWKRPFDISELREFLNASEEDFTLAMADGYMRAIQHNWKILQSNGYKIRWLTVVTIIELGGFIYLQISLFL